MRVASVYIFVLKKHDRKYLLFSCPIWNVIIIPCHLQSVLTDTENVGKTTSQVG